MVDDNGRSHLVDCLHPTIEGAESVSSSNTPERKILACLLSHNVEGETQWPRLKIRVQKD